MNSNQTQLDTVKHAFDEWRTNRPKMEKIPLYLWEMVKPLMNEYSIAMVSRALGLNYAQLKENTMDNTVNFVEAMITSGETEPTPIAESKENNHRYILHWLHTGCQWKSLKRVIDKNKEGKPEIHYSSLFRWYPKWCNDGSWQALFESTVAKLSLSDKLDLSVLHGDGTTTAAKKGGDNIGHSGHKHFKGEKIVAICDRNCNIIAPFVTAPGNRHESPLFPLMYPLI